MKKALKCKLCIRALKTGGSCARHVRGPHRAPNGTQKKGTHQDRKALSPTRYRLWQSMRVLRRFTSSQLAATSEVSYGATKRYVRELTRAGYLKEVTPPRPHRGREGEAIKVLARDSGPKPPRVRGDGTVFDPNVDRPNVGLGGGGDGSGRSKNGGMG